MANLDTKSLVLDISVNLSRIGRFVMANQLPRAHQFASEIDQQLTALSHRTYPASLNFPISQAQKLNAQMVKGQWSNPIELADDCFTYSLILQHRSKLLDIPQTA